MQYNKNDPSRTNITLFSTHFWSSCLSIELRHLLWNYNNSCYPIFRNYFGFLFIYFRITSFALEVLSDAVMSEWEYLFFIDIDILNKITLWLCAQQNKDTGSWAEIKLWYDRKMVDPVGL